MSNNKETTEVEYVELGTELNVAREGFLKLDEGQQKLQFILNKTIRKMLLAAAASQSENMDSVSVMTDIKTVRKDAELLSSITEDELERVESLNSLVELIFKFTTVFPSFKMEDDLTQEGFDSMVQLMVDQQLLVNWASKEEQESVKEFINWINVSEEATQYAAEKIAKQSDAKQTQASEEATETTKDVDAKPTEEATETTKDVDAKPTEEATETTKDADAKPTEEAKVEKKKHTIPNNVRLIRV